MKVIISSKNYDAGQRLKEKIEKKFEKLGKYFAEDTEARVMLSDENGRQKLEATIRINGTVFRAEETTNDMYVAMDKVIDKLATQMSRFKEKLKNKHKGQKEAFFEALPDMGGSEPGAERVIRKKTFELVPMTVEEAIMQMELLGHSFFVFLNPETDTASVLYRRKDGNYGLLETKQ